MPIEVTEVSALRGRELKRFLRKLAKDRTACVHLIVSSDAAGREFATDVFCQLRSANVSVLATLKAADVVCDDDELVSTFTWLKTWDQLLLKNFLELCGQWVTKEYAPLLEIESKAEFKWFEQWQLAVTDPRLHKYPSLPWRSFVRKVNTENYKYALEFLSMVALPSTEHNKQLCESRTREFIERKKKVVCIFPKQWRKAQDRAVSV